MGAFSAVAAHRAWLRACGTVVRVIAVLSAGVGLLAEPAGAQVRVERHEGEVIIRRAETQTQRLVRTAGREGTGWALVDEEGRTYRLAGAVSAYADSSSSPGIMMSTTGGRDSGGEDPIIVVGGYQDGGGRDSGGEDPIVVVGGYQDALQHLRDTYGASIEHDGLLGADIVSLPGHEDPISSFFEIVSSDSVRGYPLIHFFRTLEVASTGASDANYMPARPARPRRSFPSDPYFPLQWNVDATRLALAAWHPVTVRQTRPVRIAVIDSGINEGERDGSGLDGVGSIHHVPVAPTTGYALQHGLAVTSLLADAANDGDGVVGLVGAWSGSECRREASLSDRAQVEIYSYNVGDWGPISVEVARAIYRSIEDGVDVINLSLRTAESPSITAAIQAALNANIIVVAAAGNYDPEAMRKPASYPANIEGVIAVTSASPSGSISESAADAGYDIVAPGEQVMVGGPGNTWYEGTGTSFAAPHVSAAVALMRAAKPDLTPAEALAALQASSRADGARGATGRGEGGFLDAFAALNYVLAPEDRITADQLSRHCGIANLTGLSISEFGGKGGPELPERVELSGNSPNPFSGSTAIRYALPEAQRVRLAIYNLLGQEVRVLVDGVEAAGPHEVVVDAYDLPSGVYLYRLETAEGALSRRMVLTK